MRSRGGRVVIAASITALAGIIRLWNVTLIPGFRMDEVGENLRAMLIYDGVNFPLTNNAPFIGALYNYLIAAAFHATGPSMIIARLVVFIFGTLTVTGTFLLAEEMFDEKVAVISGLLLALQPGHILVASHVAWSASLAPFFAVFTLYSFYRAVEGGDERFWIPTGFLAALGMQAHPSTVVTVLLAPLFYLMITRKLLTTVKSKQFLLAVIAFCVGYVNMIVFNILHPMGSITSMFEARWTGVSEPLTIKVYFRRSIFILLEYLTMLCAGVPIISWKVLVSNVWFYAYICAFFSSLVLALKGHGKRDALLLLTLLIGFLVLPIGTKGVMTVRVWGFAWGPHYLQQLLPTSMTLISSLAGRLTKPTFERAGSKEGLNARTKAKPSKRAIILACGIILLMGLWPFTNLLRFYGVCERFGITNQVIIDAEHMLKTLSDEDVAIYIDRYAFQSALLARIAMISLNRIDISHGLHGGLSRPSAFMKENVGRRKLLVFSPPSFEAHKSFLSSDAFLSHVIRIHTIRNSIGQEVYFIVEAY